MLLKTTRGLSAGLLLLAACTASPPTATNSNLSRPEQDFETFWTAFRDHYAFFRLKKVDWDQQYAQYRPRITPRTSEAELLQTLEQLVTPLHDGHVTISRGDEVLFNARKPSYFKEEFKGREADYWKTSNATLQQQGFGAVQGVGPVVKGQYLYYVAHSPLLGYLRVSRCFGRMESLFDEKQEAADLQLMQHQFDSLLATLADTRGLILDLRSNGGGHGGDLLARRFCATRTLTHYKATRLPGGYEKFTPLQPIYLEPTPAGATPYRQPVAVLTNDKTASSAEDFTIALSRLPQVVTVGASTSGMLSDMYEAKLSGKLEFTLSNQRYYTLDTTLMEDVGVPPRVPVASTRRLLDEGRDKVIELGVHVLVKPR